MRVICATRHDCAAAHAAGGGRRRKFARTAGTLSAPRARPGRRRGRRDCAPDCSPRAVERQRGAVGGRLGEEHQYDHPDVEEHRDRARYQRHDDQWQRAAFDGRGEHHQLADEPAGEWNAGERQQEDGEDQRVEGRFGIGDPVRDRAVEGDPGDQREGRVGEQVVEQEVALVAPEPPIVPQSPRRRIAFSL